MELRDFGCWKGVVFVWIRRVELRGSVWNWEVLDRNNNSYLKSKSWEDTSYVDFLKAAVLYQEALRKLIEYLMKKKLLLITPNSIISKSDHLFIFWLVFVLIKVMRMRKVFKFRFIDDSRVNLKFLRCREKSLWNFLWLKFYGRNFKRWTRDICSSRWHRTFSNFSFIFNFLNWTSNFRRKLF